MKIRKLVTTILFFIVSMMIVNLNNSFAFYTEDVLEKIEYTEEYKKWQDMKYEEKMDSIMPQKYSISNKNIVLRKTRMTTSLFTSKLMMSNYDSYDLRDYINITVKNQKNTEQCWAFAVNTAIESNIEKITGNVSPIYSARYADYATSRTFLDGINENSYNREVNEGGFPEIILGLYTSGRGPVLEDDFPFSTNTEKINLSEIQNIEVQKQVKGYERFEEIYKKYNNGIISSYTDASGKVYTNEEVNKIRNQIKEHIINYGAVLSQTYGAGGTNGSARIYYNNPDKVLESTAYFCNKENLLADHQILIIGWDDNYAIDNFNENFRPSTPGAYIVLNSWGEDFGDNGVYYISYEDCFIERSILGITSVTDVDYDTVYQHDELGNNEDMAAAGSIYGANVFERDDVSKKEMLTQISISSLISSTCDVYVNNNSGELNVDDCIKVASNLKIKDGYYTLELDTPIELKGNEFAIIVKYNADETGISYFGIECPDEYLWKTATAEKGESYLSVNGNNWDDFVELSISSVIPENSNLCIKAFTEYIENNDVSEDKNENDFIEFGKYKIDNEYIYGISPNTKLQEFTNNISTNLEYYIYKNEKQIIDNEDIISTGMTLRVEDKVYKLVVLGDSDGNGKITITDCVKARLHLVNKKLLVDEFKKATDVNDNGKITITDIVIINLASVNLREL